MTTGDYAVKLARYVRSLPDFIIFNNIDGNYNHLGAIIADAVLQANMKYETHVRPRIKRIRRLYPEAATMPGLRQTLAEITTINFLNWRGFDRIERFDTIVGLLLSEGVETQNDLKGWLMDEINIGKLASIKGVGPKTIDYFKILTGIQTCAIDRRLLDFLDQAGIETSSYDEAKEIVNLAADIMEVPRSCFDHSIWQFIGKQGMQSCR